MLKDHWYTTKAGFSHAPRITSPLFVEGDGGSRRSRRKKGALDLKEEKCSETVLA